MSCMEEDKVKLDLMKEIFRKWLEPGRNKKRKRITLIGSLCRWFRQT